MIKIFTHFAIICHFDSPCENQVMALGTVYGNRKMVNFVSLSIFEIRILNKKYNKKTLVFRLQSLL